MPNCKKCPKANPMSATHYPQAEFQLGAQGMQIIVDTPVCAEHRVPLVESFLNRHEIAVYSARFEAQYGVKPDITRTKMRFLLVGDPKVGRFLEFLQKSKEERAKKNAADRTPIVVEVVPDDELPGADE